LNFDSTVNFEQQETEDTKMRVVILAAAASLAFAGAAMARESVYHHHHHTMHHHYNNATAPLAEGAAPGDNLSNHDQYMRNLHDSGYNPHGDLDAYGNIRQN
jgi:hypothetical protein